MTTYSAYNPQGTTRTSKRGIGRHVPLLPNHFNHRWFDAYVDDFLDKNVLENDGVVSGCVISQDGGNDSINITSGEVYIGGSKVTFTSSGSPFVCPTDGWYIAYIDNGGTVTYGLLENDTSQGALTPDDSVVVGFAIRGNGVFYITSFFNEISDYLENLDKTKHVQPDIIVGPTLLTSRSTHLETTFIAALSPGDKLLFLSGVTLTANRVIAAQVELLSDGPATQIVLDTFDLTLSEVSGYISITTTTGKLILNGICHDLIINGSVTVERGSSFSGSYVLNGNIVNKTEHIKPSITVGPTLTNTRATDLETTFITSLSEGDKLLFLNSTILTANRTLTTEVEVWMDGPDAKIDIDTFNLTFVEVSGKITITSSTGKLILNGRTHGLIIIGNVIVEQGDNFSGTYSKDGELFYQGQIIPTSSPEIWGTDTQVDNLEANFHTDASGAPLDKNDDPYTLSDDDEILVNHNATLAANLKLQPVSSKILKIGMAKGITLDFGDSGSGVPFKFEVGSNIATESDIAIRGTFKFDETTLAIADKRIVNNRAYGVKIRYNNDDIFDPAHSGDMVFKDTEAFNPYLIPYLGEQFDWLDNASNDNKTLLRDLNRVLGGLVFDGTDYVETKSRFSLPAIAAYKFQVNKGFGFLRQLAVDDPDIHSRTDINGVSVADTASFVNTTNIVTFVSIADIKNGMRINGGSAPVPVGTNGTTILKNINTTTKTAEMVDALTGNVVNASSTVGSIAVTMDNSGAAGGSKQIDAGQGHLHEVLIGDGSGPVFKHWSNNSTADSTGGTISDNNGAVGIGIATNDGTNGPPRVSSVTRDKSILTNYYQRA